MSNGSEPAFPVAELYVWQGLSKRELIAAMCLQGLLSSDGCYSCGTNTPIAEAIKHADELLARLSNDSE